LSGLFTSCPAIGRPAGIAFTQAKRPHIPGVTALGCSEPGIVTHSAGAYPTSTIPTVVSTDPVITPATEPTLRPAAESGVTCAAAGNTQNVSIWDSFIAMFESDVHASPCY
jgi:hypothetical protein